MEPRVGQIWHYESFYLEPKNGVLFVITDIDIRACSVYFRWLKSFMPDHASGGQFNNGTFKYMYPCTDIEVLLWTLK